MPKPRVLICHERFLMRFGADRVLIIIGQRLAALGWEVVFLGQRFDRALIEGFAAEVAELPAPSQYHLFDVETAAWLKKSWLPGRAFDLVIDGGWPFFAAMPLFRSCSPCVLFIDCGVVPVDGYPEGTQAILRHLTELRRRHLPACTHIAANSRFTLESQTLPEAGRGPRCLAVLNGIDHLPLPAPDAEPPPGEAIDLVKRLEREGRKLVLCLGRFETVGYKNSGAALRLLERLHRVEPKIALLVLDHAGNCQPAPHLRPFVFPLGFPDDLQLAWIMGRARLGVSVSLWEGFNLPIAEMYRIGRPALVFNLAAHPEVVAHPWFLCADLDEMASKTALLLSAPDAGRSLAPIDVAAYRARFTWEGFVRELLVLTGLTAA